MKLAVAGKGGVGKTSLTAWLGDYLARQGDDVWLVDADTALSLGAALGIAPDRIPRPLIEEEELIQERVGAGMINLSPDVSDLPERLCVNAGPMHLLVMGSIAGAGGGCACSQNTLLKALLAHLVLDRGQTMIVDLEAGVEHLGRGTVSGVDGLVVVSEPSLRSLNTAAQIGTFAAGLGLTNQVLVLNRAPQGIELPALQGLPPLAGAIPVLETLQKRQLTAASVLDLPERDQVDTICTQVLNALE
ncbi:MAG: ArsA-related P-loop ATPase [Desulfovibrionales bacterium]